MEGPESSSPVGGHSSADGDKFLTELPARLASDPTQSPSEPAPSEVRSHRDSIARNADGSPANLPLQQRPSTTFAEELKGLSLEATAERHLGSTSGVSFAKLTQMVLRRLSPDKIDFVFAKDHENSNGAALLNFPSPLDLADHTLFERLNESISIHPSLFGDFGLADILQPNDTITGPDLLSDEAHVNRLVDFYFAHSHSLYPIIHRGDFLKSLQDYRDGGRDPSLPPPLFVFRMWMVLAIGSTAYSAISLTEESESRMYYSEALRYLEQAMSGDLVRTPELFLRYFLWILRIC